jgi:23S rRNA pseudouridine2604 synthase
VTVLVNKPVGFVSGQAEDGYQPARVLVTREKQWREDRSADPLHAAAPAKPGARGRLDIDSVGLLVLTQDGRIAKQLVGEGGEIEKEYLVRVASKTGAPLAPDKLALLRHGLSLDDEPLRRRRSSGSTTTSCASSCPKARSGQIRRMCEAVGLQVLGLKRVRHRRRSRPRQACPTGPVALPSARA